MVPRLVALPLRLVGRCAAIVAVALAWPVAAAAQELPPITDREFALDAYDGVAIGSIRIVGMGGAALATAEGSAGTLLNAAAPAVRPATSTAGWDWDFHLDALSSTGTSDHDNSGRAGTDSTTITTFGLAGVLGDWGLAVVGTTLGGSSPGLTGERLDVSLARAKLALARTFRNEAYTAGVALRVGTFSLTSTAAGELFSITGSSLELGGMWRPYRGDARVGLAAALPVTGTQVDTSACDPMACAGHVLPERMTVPWQVAIGAAYRLAPTRWNQWVGGDFRDERSVLFAADLVLTGAVADGAGLEAFGRGELQRSGRSVVVSPRLGAEYEWLPGRLRLRAGTYWEPARLAGSAGRVHGTAGLEVRWLQFALWGQRRLRLSFTFDGARRYQNGGVSVGFWH